MWLMLPILFPDTQESVNPRSIRWSILAAVGLIWASTLSIKIGLLGLVLAGVLAWLPWRRTHILATRYLEMMGLWASLMLGVNVYNYVAARIDINSVLAPWKLRLEADSVIDPEMNRQLYVPTALAHPVVRYLPTFLFYTGCSIQAPFDIRTHEVILSPRLLRDAPDLSQNTFFGDFAPYLDERVGPTIQAVVQYAGKGRIGVWSDSTLFSNFAIPLPGKMELAVGFLDFLNRQNRFPQLRLLFIGTGCILAVIGLWGLRAVQSMIIIAVWGGVCGGSGVAAICYSEFYPALQPHTPFEKIGFLESEDTDHLPILRPIDDPYPNSYLTAFVGVLRTGKYAETFFETSQCPSYSQVVVIHGHQVRDWETLSDFVYAGGRLIVLDGGAAPEALAQASKIFGIRYVSMPSRTSLKKSATSVEIAGYFQSGIPLLADSEARALLIAQKFGRGEVYLSATVALFSDTSLGEPASVPDAIQLGLLKLIFRIYSD